MGNARDRRRQKKLARQKRRRQAKIRADRQQEQLDRFEVDVPAEALQTQRIRASDGHLYPKMSEIFQTMLDPVAELIGAETDNAESLSSVALMLSLAWNVSRSPQSERAGQLIALRELVPGGEEAEAFDAMSQVLIALAETLANVYPDDPRTVLSAHVEEDADGALRLVAVTDADAADGDRSA